MQGGEALDVAYERGDVLFGEHGGQVGESLARFGCVEVGHHEAGGASGKVRFCGFGELGGDAGRGHALFDALQRGDVCFGDVGRAWRQHDGGYLRAAAQVLCRRAFHELDATMCGKRERGEKLAALVGQGIGRSVGAAALRAVVFSEIRQDIGQHLAAHGHVRHRAVRAGEKRAQRLVALHEAVAFVGCARRAETDEVGLRRAQSFHHLAECLFRGELRVVRGEKDPLACQVLGKGCRRRRAIAHPRITRGNLVHEALRGIRAAVGVLPHELGFAWCGAQKALKVLVDVGAAVFSMRDH